MNKKQNTNSEKGKFLEEIIFRMYKSAGTTVTKNAYLRPLTHTGNKRKKREIDILITNKIAGIDIPIAIECKNEKKIIGVPKIDSFIGKLSDVGIPSQLGIYISASGYTKGAIERAREANVKTLLFKEVDGETLNKAVQEAIKSLIYLLLDINTITIANNVSNPPDDLKFFYNDKGKICGTIADLVWKNWIDGNVPISIGSHRVELKIPNGWHQIICGKTEPIISAFAEVVVYGLLVMVPGESSKYVLIDQHNNKVDRTHFDIMFNDQSDTYPVEVFDSEDSLRERLIQKQCKVHFSLGRFKISRIKNGPLFWPPSLHTISQLSKLSQITNGGKTIDMSTLKIEDIEGSSLSAVWEPIYSRYLELFQYDK